jgi:hypothetical protein
VAAPAGAAGNQMTASGLGTSLLQSCEDLTSGIPKNVGIDCNKPEFANLCSNCMAPGAQSKPECAWLFNTPNNANLPNPGLPTAKAGGDPNGTLDDIFNQNPDLSKDHAAQENKVLAGNQPGGGMPPGGGPLGGGPPPAAGGPGSSGYKTDIERGIGMSGYSSGGGFSGGGYTNPNAVAANSPFDLRQYLPGGKKDPKRNIAGMRMPASAGIGARYDDIWERISRRVTSMCVSNRLLECNGKSVKNQAATKPM